MSARTTSCEADSRFIRADIFQFAKTRHAPSFFQARREIARSRDRETRRSSEPRGRSAIPMTRERVFIRSSDIALRCLFRSSLPRIRVKRRRVAASEIMRSGLGTRSRCSPAARKRRKKRKTAKEKASPGEERRKGECGVAEDNSDTLYRATDV